MTPFKIYQAAPTPMASRPATEPNWARFYEAMTRLGPRLLTGIPREWVSWLQEEGRSSDMIFSEYMGSCMEDLWTQNKEMAVHGELEYYLDAVKRALSEWPLNDGVGWQVGSDSDTGPDWDEYVARIGIRVQPRAVRVLIRAAEIN